MYSIDLETLITRAGLPAAAAEALRAAAKDTPPQVKNIIDKAMLAYREDTNFPYEEYRLQLEALDNADLWQMLYVFTLAEHLYTLYMTSGRGEELFDGILRDFTAKVRECYDFTGAWGIRSAKWYNRWFNLERIALRRLQFEVRRFGNNYRGLTPDDPAINVHIPSTGPLDEALCEEDYRRAAAFFADRFEGPVPFMCHSWLLNPEHPAFLPPTSRLLPFQAKYDIFKFDEHTEFLWRLFGTAYNGDPNSLTERNSLERAYKAHLLAGGKVGEGKGVFFLS